RDSSAALMAQLNEAYAVLSHTNQRREYDEKLRLYVMLAAKVTTADAPDATLGHTRTTTRTAGYARIRPSSEVDPAVISEFSQYLWSKITAKEAGFSWKKTPFDGFHWGAEATSWSSCYFAACRGFSILDAATAKKFLNYSDIGIAAHERRIRKCYFAFLMP